MEYPPRPSPVGVCKCGHKYTQHRLRDSDDEWKVGNWYQRNILYGNVFSIGWKIFRKECGECMCPKYEQVKIIDEKTGNEIPKLETEKQ